MLQSNESGEEFNFKLKVKNEESKRSNESTNNSSNDDEVSIMSRKFKKSLKEKGKYKYYISLVKVLKGWKQRHLLLWVQETWTHEGWMSKVEEEMDSKKKKKGLMDTSYLREPW